MSANPCIQQCVARPGIEAGCIRFVRWQNGDVADAANIQHHSVRTLRAKQELMKDGGKWSTLSATGHVCAPKIRDGRDAGAGRDHARVADL